LELESHLHDPVGIGVPLTRSGWNWSPIYTIRLEWSPTYTIRLEWSPTYTIRCNTVIIIKGFWFR